MNKYLYTLLLAFSSLFMAEAQQLFDLKRCIETGLEQNYSIRIIRNEQQISDNNATPGNAGYLPTVDMSGGFSGNFNNNRNSLQDGSIEKANGINSETGNVGLNVNWTVFDGFGIQAEYSRLKELQRIQLLQECSVHIRQAFRGEPIRCAPCCPRCCAPSAPKAFQNIPAS